MYCIFTGAVAAPTGKFWCYGSSAQWTSAVHGGSVNCNDNNLQFLMHSSVIKGVVKGLIDDIPKCHRILSRVYVFKQEKHG